MVSAQKRKILEGNWDYLLILDACRYDYFDRFYSDYFGGRIGKLWSPASETSGWCKAIFQEMYEEIVYISANPRINSKIEVDGFDAGNYFYKVIDVWDCGWNDKRGTVLPRTVNKYALKARKNYPERRLIIHYLQPHVPYLNIGPLDYKKGKNPKRQNANSISKKVRRFIGPRIREIFGPSKTRKIRGLLGLRPTGALEATIREIGEDEIPQLYKENVRRVLEEVTVLVSRLEGKIILTADHGELLGEKGYYGHPRGKDIPELREVPWLEVRRVDLDDSRGPEKEKIAQKVNSLKKEDKI